VSYLNCCPVFGVHFTEFFVEKNAAGTTIDYLTANSGQLQRIPTGKSLAALGQDYIALPED
jgi:hypothetical protein